MKIVVTAAELLKNPMKIVVASELRIPCLKQQTPQLIFLEIEGRSVDLLKIVAKPDAFLYEGT